MNKYEALFNIILMQTKSGELKWSQLRRNANSDLIFNPNLVFRQFSATLIREGGDYTLLLVEKKYDDPDQDLAYEKYQSELLVVDEGELVATLSDSVIDPSKLMRLANMVETRSDKARKLFGTGEM